MMFILSLLPLVPGTIRLLIHGRADTEALWYVALGLFALGIAVGRIIRDLE